MSSGRGWGLFPKYAAALGLFVALLMVGGGAVELGLIYREVRDAAAAVQKAEARAAAVRIDQFLSTIVAAVSEVSALPFARGGMQAADRREEFHRLMKIVPAIGELRWVDASDRERLKVSRVQSDAIDSLKDLGGLAEIRDARRKRSAIGQPYFRDGSEPFVTIAVRDVGPQAGVTLADLDLKFVADVVRQIHLGATGRVYVIDNADRVVAHPNLDLVLQRTQLSQYEPLRQVRAELVRSGGSVVGMIEGPALESGVRALISAVSIPSASWLVAAEQARDEVLAPVYEALARSAILLLGGLCAALLVSYWLARRLSRPVLEVRRGAAQIARGDLSARIDVKTGDEIEALATEFNAMAAQLQQYTTGLERMVAEKTAELQAALRAKAVFLAAASHDLRQPLYAISILADALSLEELPPSAAGALDKQREAIAVLRTLFDNLLDLSRFDAGAVKPAMRDVALRDALAPLAAEYEIVCKQKRLAWSYDVADLRVRTDPELLRRLVGNLLSNAVRYTDAGSVRLAARAEAGRVLLEVVDTGIGIAPEDQRRVFDEFVQLGNPSREREKGVGLGLSIVRKIDELLGTRISLASSPGGGTRVALEVALAGESAHPAEKAAARDAFDLSGLRLWIVEDDRLVRDALATQFAAWGVDYDFAANRAEMNALRDKDGTWPDAAVLDDMLAAGERGLDIARWLAAHMPKERIAFVTGNVDPDRLRLLADSGFLVMRKPIATAELAQWLARAVRSSPVAAP